MNRSNSTVILMADDDLDDCELTRRALAQAGVTNPLQFVHDGAELLDYLRQEPPYDKEGAAPRPGLLLLDLNMPRVDGREALQRIKALPGLRNIPVVVLTTSQAEEDVLRTYDLGAASYITKPVTFTGLVEAMTILGEYWLEVVALPTPNATR